MVINREIFTPFGVSTIEYRKLHDMLGDDNPHSLVSETWMVNGLVHREGGPAKTTYKEETGELISEDWHHFGRCIRIDGGPTSITYVDGVKYRETWIVSMYDLDTNSDQIHQQVYYANGVMSYRRWVSRSTNTLPYEEHFSIDGNTLTQVFHVFGTVYGLPFVSVSVGKFGNVWSINHEEIPEIQDWIERKNLPHWSTWNDEIISLFHLRWL